MEKSKTKRKIYKLRKYLSGSVYDLENISKKQIQCVCPKLFNDPIDTYFYYSSDKCFEKSKKILTQEIMNTIRICCFIDHSGKKGNKLCSSDILMWTHYANSHKGLCLEFDVPALDFDFLNSEKYDEKKTYLQPISYQKNLATDFESLFSSSEDDSYSKDKFEDLLKTCFFTKDDSFSYEQEIRLLKYVNDTTKEREPLSFDYLKKIIFGKRCDNDMKYLIRCLNKEVYKNKIELYEIDEHFKEVKYDKL